MLERFLHRLSLSDVGTEEIAATRERLKDRFKPGATRRMTQLGMLVGAAVEEVGPQPEDAVVYASAYAESRALESYLESFPTASPTLFQTSIHPSAVQQVLIGRQQPVGEFYPLTGRAHLVAHTLQAALLAKAPRVIVCGGEERGTWLLERGAASDRTFAFAFALSREPAGAMAEVVLAPTEAAAVELGLPAFFDALLARHPLAMAAAPGLWFTLRWL